jgi:Leucyl aminopeptidase
MAAHLAQGARLRAYRFDKYRTREKPEQKQTLKRLTFMLDDHGAAKKAFDPLEKIAEGVTLTRDLVSEPANVIYPVTLAERAKKLADLGVQVEVLGEKQMKKLGMGALLGVGPGLGAESQLVIMQWRGAADAKQRPIAFVGKGITFDTGGISIKPAQGMEDMKWDMAGAGHGDRAHACAGRAQGQGQCRRHGRGGGEHALGHRAAPRRYRDLPIRPDHRSHQHRCGGSARSRRCALVLPGTVQAAGDRRSGDLTGAVIVALGNVHGGLFSNNDTLAERLAAAGKATGELLWRLPLADAYDKQINSDAADMKNVGGRNGGSITAAQFLQRFIKDTPWAHLDIAGMAWSDKDAPTVPKGATAFGVRLLERLVADHYEER